MANVARRAGCVVACWFLCGAASSPGADSPAEGLAKQRELASRVVVVANSRQTESVELARFYAAERGIPAANIIALPLPTDESITWRQFVDQVYQPLQDELFRQGWIEGAATSLLDRFGRKRYAFVGQRISYLVVCRGTPLRIFNDPTLLSPAKFQPELRRNEASVDSELSLLAFSGEETTGLLANPLFEREGLATPDGERLVKVCRLDGPTWESARRLVTSARGAEAAGLAGRYYVDVGGPHADGDAWLRAAADELEQLGFDGEVEDSGRTFESSSRFDAPAFYFGWYAGNLEGPMANKDFAFPAGAIAVHIHSYSAHTLRDADAGWCGPFVARGVAATVGNVFEPFLGFTHRPAALLRALSRGKNFGDAVYYALPALSWQAVAVGDPLYTPFKVPIERQLARAEPSVYAVIRQANLLERAGQRAAALELLRRHAAGPDLVTALALARSLRAEPEGSAEVRRALAFAASREFDSGQWPLAREAARLLAANAGEAEALTVYRRLAATPAPSEHGRRALLSEARDLAMKKGEPELAREFEGRLNAAP